MQFTNRTHFLTDRHTDSKDMNFTDRNFNSRTVTVRVYWTTLYSFRSVCATSHTGALYSTN